MSFFIKILAFSIEIFSFFIKRMSFFSVFVFPTPRSCQKRLGTLPLFVRPVKPCPAVSCRFPFSWFRGGICDSGNTNYHCFVGYYPTSIDERFRKKVHAGRADGASAVGTAATFVCGSFVRFTLLINQERKQIVEAKYQTNGCGFMIATAEIIAEAMTQRFVTELHGLDNAWLNSLIETKLGLFEDGRQQCKDTCFEAIQAAFFDYRALQVEEFQGEKALICTCFGVTEETIALVIGKEKASSVEQVAELCNAGSGCGSCRMMIQEMIDQSELVDGFRVLHEPADKA